MELPKRKSPRLKYYDYSTPGMYFITICTYHHKCILSKINPEVTQNIVGTHHDASENRNAEKTPVGTHHDASALGLTLYGKYVDEIVNKTEDRFDIKIHKYVIMPNHIHMIIEIKGDKQTIRESSLQARSLLSKVVGYLKMNASKKIHQTYQNKNIWQARYHDHIIRNEKEYIKIWDYIDKNPIKWEFDCFYNEG